MSRGDDVAAQVQREEYERLLQAMRVAQMHREEERSLLRRRMLDEGALPRV